MVIPQCLYRLLPKPKAKYMCCLCAKKKPFHFYRNGYYVCSYCYKRAFKYLDKRLIARCLTLRLL